MLTLKEIKKNYNDLPGFDKGILREYLQYKILDIFYKSNFGQKLSFLGGTAIRICYGSFRFSEDLDFDVIDLTEKDFNDITVLLEKELKLLGYNIEIKTVHKGAFHIYIKFLDVLFNNDLSVMRDEKLMIQIDAVQKNFLYKSEDFLLSKFDVFRNILIAPKDIVLSKKVGAIFGRKRAKGRDFYDIIYLMSLTDFNYEYLKEQFGIKDKKDLKKELLSKIKDFNFDQLSRDVAPFLINQDEIERVLSFREYIEQVLK